MKSSDEMIASLLARREDYLASCKQKQKKNKKTVLLLLSLSIALLGGITAWLTYTHKMRNIPGGGEESSAEEDPQSNIPAPCPPDVYNEISLGGPAKYYSAIEGSDSLPEGYL